MAEDRLRIRSDSVVAKRIVRSFIDFLDTVEVVPGVDPEGLEVSAQCLIEVFRLQGSREDPPGISLIDVFTQSKEPVLAEARPKSETSTTQEGFRCFVEGLESAGYFSSATSNSEHEARLAHARATYEETSKAFKGADQSNLLAEAFKAQGNVALASRHYTEAIELYTLAISICNDNAIYLANRAAAHTQAGNFAAAITDCHKAIEINPRYSKAYSRLGTVHFSQGRYLDALRWYKKALEVDPLNTSANDNIQAAQQKLDEMAERGRDSPQAGASAAVMTAEFEPATSNSAAGGSPECQIGVTCEGPVPVDFLDTVIDMFDNQPSNSPREPANNSGRQAPAPQPDPLTGFVQSVFQGINPQSGAQAPNLMEMFGGFPHYGAGRGQASSNSGASVPIFADRLQSALQSILGIPENTRGTSTQENSQQNRQQEQ